MWLMRHPLVVAGASQQRHFDQRLCHRCDYNGIGPGNGLQHDPFRLRPIDLLSAQTVQLEVSCENHAGIFSPVRFSYSYSIASTNDETPIRSRYFFSSFAP